METNWIILALVLIAGIVLIVFLIIRNQKDKRDVINSMNAEDDLKEDAVREEDID